jgi:hypothetical protein
MSSDGSKDRVVLETVATVPTGVGWYGVAIRLGMRGIILEEPLPRVLDRLVERGYLKYQDEGPPGSDRTYYLTDKGRKDLE